MIAKRIMELLREKLFLGKNGALTGVGRSLVKHVNVLINYLNNFYIAYLDNILIYSKDAKSYKQHINIVLE
jgi:hypothetical protein